MSKQKKKPDACFRVGDSSWESMLRSRVIRNVAVKVEGPDEEGMLYIAVKNRKPKWCIPPISWIMRLPDEKVLEIDKLGAEVLDMCSESPMVEEVVEAFSKKYFITFHEARISVINYISVLVKKGALAVQII
ncbi:MAG: PqqD family protein [Spartobacteria bacterium]|nr:PqqD family protein [Spartobacteria bacterium]